MEPTYYGQTDGSAEVKTVQERAREYYSIRDFVVIKNIDEKPFTYQVQRPENLDYDQPDTVSMVVTQINPPERITMQPGAMRLVPAYEADLMIKNLIDKMVMSNRAQIIKEAKITGVDNPVFPEAVMDPSTQHKYFRAIYQGKRDFMAEFNQELADRNATASQVLDDLDITKKPATKAPAPKQPTKEPEVEQKRDESTPPPEKPRTQEGESHGQQAPAPKQPTTAA